MPVLGIPTFGLDALSLKFSPGSMLSNPLEARVLSARRRGGYATPKTSLS